MIAGFRHRVVHDYFGVDLDAVWIIATREVPLLRAAVIKILASDFPEEAANERGGDPVGNYPESPDSSVGTLQLKAP